MTFYNLNEEELLEYMKKRQKAAEALMSRYLEEEPIYRDCMHQGHDCDGVYLDIEANENLVCLLIVDGFSNSHFYLSNEQVHELIGTLQKILTIRDGDK